MKPKIDSDADLRSADGQFSVELISKIFGITVDDVGQAIGRTDASTLGKTPGNDSLQKSLQMFADIALLRAAGLSSDQFRAWLNSANAGMDERAPLDLIRAGHLVDVAGFVYGALTGEPA